MADNLNGIPFSSDEEGINYPLLARRAVMYNYNELGIGTRRGDEIDPLRLYEVYVVWFAFVRGNWKAILSTSRPDGRMYEVSYAQDGQIYVDTYLKTHNTDVTEAVQ